ncbi:M48 family metallopeptidase [Sporohalobacter salinus]|uniref:M48 family metallopeptidase n=1 Tax=Sporohalobacter salinus TaxID=1494606 RepID=UPI001960BBBB|nr:M48 family metallopeptidase [Sporohalobacter salinus]MBM7624610.1 putative Zn-dependent protease [Sporohalobacter salinus]
MIAFKRKKVITFLLITFLILGSISVQAVSDYEKKLSKKYLEHYLEEYGKAKLKPKNKKRSDKIFSDLASEAEKDASDLDFKYYVIDNPAINAVNIGNGYILIYKGLFKLLENDQQLAALIAHEMGHGVNNDMQEKIDINQKIQIGAVIFDLAQDGKLNKDKINPAVGITVNLLVKKYDRSQEREADIYSAHLLDRAGYDPRGVIGLLRLLKRKSGSVNLELLELVKSHPNLDTRINYVADVIKRQKEAEKLYYSPISTTRQLAKGLLQNKDKKIYSTYAEIIHKNFTMAEFKEKEKLKKIEDKVARLKEKYNLKYTLELRNQVEGTARVAILFYNNEFAPQNKVTSLAIDLVKGKYGWKVLRGPQTY